MKVVVAGGTGFIGTHLVRGLTEAGHEAIVLTRRRPAEAGGLPGGAEAVQWDPSTPDRPLAQALAGADAIVNLAGTNIGTAPWTRGRRTSVLESRLQATKTLVDAFADVDPPRRPGALVNASGIDYYGDRDEEAVAEPAGPGTSFLATVCRLWEAEARKAETLGVRVATLRTGLVLSGGALSLRLLALPFRLFVGGPLGSGRQWVSWIHVDDVVGLYRLAIEDAEIAGAMNMVAPNPCRNEELAAEIGRVLGRPARLRTPQPLLRLALGGMADLVLHGRRAVPEVATGRGYEYRYPTLDAALEDALG